jgi:hypothetical protein
MIKRDAILRMLEMWKAGGTAFNPGVDPALLADFTERTGRHLPQSVAGYLMMVNGMRRFDADRWDFSFLSLEDLLPAADLSFKDLLPAADGIPSQLELPEDLEFDSRNCFVVIDYFLGSAFFMIEAFEEPGEDSRVLRSVGAQIHEAFHSFGDLIDAYLEDPMSIIEASTMSAEWTPELVAEMRAKFDTIAPMIRNPELVADIHASLDRVLAELASKKEGEKK